MALSALSWLFLLLTALATSRLIGSLGADMLALRLLNGLIVLPWLIALLTVVSVALLAPVWRGRYWQLRGRVYYSLLAGAALAFTWFLAFWKLLGSA